jgi:hypothetical protein
VIVTILLLLVIAISITGFCISMRPEAREKRRNPPPPQYCTKHMIVSSRIPGGPDHMSWVYGVQHRTLGNACDGPKHHRGSGWW